jgi:UDP-N-acetylmuramyl pentapeptide phosphotransferase/UDP-N-acetylglucosamine-1-phosphate transferase
MTLYDIPIPVLALCCFLITLIGTRLLILALRKRTVLIDIPNLRSNHKVPTPKGGGLAVVMALVICLLIADISFGIILSLLILTAISLLDDLIGIPVIVRLLVQIVAVAIPLSGIRDPILNDLLPLWLDHTIIALLWVWFINLFNFMDGIDGLAGTEMFCIGLGLCLLIALMGNFPDNLSVYSLLVLAAAGGFLWWNWHPAKIFLGDVGSIPIGFLLGYLLLLALQQGHFYSVLILPAYYLSDGGITLLARLRRGEKPWVAHSEHYYQQAVRNGRSHAAVARSIFGINLLLIMLSTLAVLDTEIALFHLTMAYLSVFMLLGYFAHETKTEK